MSKGMIKNMETKYHKMMCKLIDIPVTTRYSAVLSEMGLNRFETLVDIQKICYINSIIRQDKTTKITRELLDADHKAVSEFNEKIKKSKAKKKPKERESIYDEITRLCRKHNVPPIFECNMWNDTIRTIAKKNETLKNWEDIKQGHHTIVRKMPRTKNKPYQRFNKKKGRAIMLWRCGMLKFRHYWRNYYQAINQSVTCPHPLCGENDTWLHALECPFMDTKLGPWEKDTSEDDRMVNFIMSLNQERSVRYMRPLL